MDIKELQAFQARMGVPLSKALASDDFTGIRKDVDPSGADEVDHLPELNAHPKALDAPVEEYRKAISSQAPIMRTSPHTLAGASAKNVYRFFNPTNLPAGKQVLVKPYHESLHPKAAFWQNHKIQGWAEMTNQALWHAAGMGDMHQKVHVSEHDIGPGFEKHPLVVVHMEPKTKYVEDLEPWEYHPQMQAEAAKIGIMDFLSNNLDRHRRNLLVRPDKALDEKGLPYQSRLVGIDHGRSFQYHASHKGIPSFVDHPVFGRVPTDQELRAERNRLGKQVDSLAPYMHADGLWKVSTIGRQHGAMPIFDKGVMLPLIQRWWPTVRERVAVAFTDRLRGIKNPLMKKHLADNFISRMDKLDDIAARPDWYAVAARKSDLEVPLKVWNR